jgi:hypothetical protein
MHGTAMKNEIMVFIIALLYSLFYPDMTGHKNLAFANCKSRGSNISVSLCTFTTLF